MNYSIPLLTKTKTLRSTNNIKYNNNLSQVQRTIVHSIFDYLYQTPLG